MSCSWTVLGGRSVEDLVPLVHRTVNRYHCYTHHIHWNNYHSMDSSIYRYFRLGYTVKYTYYPSYMPRHIRLKFQCIYHGNIDLIRGIFPVFTYQGVNFYVEDPNLKPNLRSHHLVQVLSAGLVGRRLRLQPAEKLSCSFFSFSNDLNDHLRFLFNVKNDCNFQNIWKFSRLYKF